MLETILLLSTAITTAVVFFKGVLVQQGWFSSQSEQNQSLILQLIAFACGVLGAFSWQVNVFAGLVQFAGMPAAVGIVITGLVAAGGSEFIHVIAALIGVRANVVAQTAVKAKAQSAGPSREDFAPFA